MAERRMFSKTIIDSDLFLDMSLSTQALYFHLSMRADDDGFVNNPRKIQRMIGASDDELKMLVAKKFIIPFDSGICVIKHWRIHNYIQKDRYKKSLYTDEITRLDIAENKEYQLKENLDTECIQKVSTLDTQVRLDKVREDKASIGYSSSNEEDELSEIMRFCQKIEFKLKKIDAKDFLEIYGLQKVKQGLKTISTSNSEIKNPAAYLAATLQDLCRDKKVDITINKNKREKNFEERPFDKTQEEDLLGWDD